MMPAFAVTRAHLIAACNSGNWDLLDKLLEIDNTHINDLAIYTDTWGEWWGLLQEAVRNNTVDGVRVLLKHGAKRDVESWGDGIAHPVLEVAEDKPAILALLQSPAIPAYVRGTDPQLPALESSDDQTVNAQGEIRDRTGIVFQAAALKKVK